MLLSPTSKRRRDEQRDVDIHPQQQLQVSSSPHNMRTGPQQQVHDGSTNNHHDQYRNHARYANAENVDTRVRMAGSFTDSTEKRPTRKTVVVLDAPQNNRPSSALRTVQEELDRSNSLRSLSSAASYSSALEFVVDGDATDNENMTKHDINSNNNSNNASSSTSGTARKSSDSSSSINSSSRNGHQSTAVRRRTPHDTNARNDATTPPENSDHTEFNDDSHSNDDHEILSGWESFVVTISNVPDDEYYTKSCATSYDVLQKLRITLGYAISNQIVQTIVVFLIIINALLMGVATFDFVTEDPEVSHIFYIVDLIFLIIFTIELGLQLFYRGISLVYDGWLLFDLIIIVLSWSLQSIQIIRAFRIFRALRLVARLQVLRELITALGAVMPRMYAISMLLFLIFYIFAVLFTQLFGELELSGNYFSTLDASLFTCMNMMTLEWINVTREVMTHLSWAWAPISSFISITGFIVYNLVVAVVCDAVAVLDRTKQQEADAAKKEVDDMEHAVAQRGQMQITQHRFEELSNNIERMKQQHINICHTVDMLTSELATINDSYCEFAATTISSTNQKTITRHGKRSCYTFPIYYIHSLFIHYVNIEYVYIENKVLAVTSTNSIYCSKKY